MLKPTETPLPSWDKLGLDIFQLKGIHYLLTVDYFSQFPVLQRLSTIHSQSIINNLKQIFTEMGVPSLHSVYITRVQRLYTSMEHGT